MDASRFDILLDHQSLSQGQNYQGQPSRDRGWYFAGSTDAVARLTLCNGKLRTKATGQEDMHHGCCDEAPETDVPTQESVYAVHCLQVTDWSAADAD